MGSAVKVTEQETSVYIPNTLGGNKAGGVGGSHSSIFLEFEVLCSLFYFS